MSYKKEIVVLSGDNQKGFLKISSFNTQKLKVVYNLEFKPQNAIMYILTDRVSEFSIKDSRGEFVFNNSPIDQDLVFLLNNGVNQLFGANSQNVNRSEAKQRVDDHIKRKEEISNRNTIDFDTDNTIEKKYETKKEDISNRNAVDFDTDNTIEKKYETKKDEESTKLSEDDEPILYEKLDDEENLETDKNLGLDILNLKEQRTTSFEFDEGVRYDGTNFYFAIKPQLDEMFVCYPDEKTLNALIENSKWVRVDTTERDFYVVGILFEDDVPQYLCYGVPGKFNIKPTAELEEVCVWLPLDTQNQQKDGYWVIYQSAKDGSVIKIS